MAQGLKRLHELRNEFVFIAAHELRAPTTVIKGYISMILEGDTGVITHKTKGFLQEADKANQQLLQLVSDLLEIARSEAQRIEIKVTPIDLEESVASVLSEIQSLTGEKHISVLYNRSRDSHTVLADTTRVKEIMMNLVTNAIKYNRKEGTITVTHEVRDREIITHVQDTGFGMPAREQNKIFEKFYRTTTARKSGEQGTGLGLFITKELIERMGGKIWFQSKEGEGSIFSFSLPKGDMVIGEK